MLAIARALMGRPSVLLLDEPSLGLAPRMVEEIFGIVGKISAEGAAVLLVEQNAALALGVAQAICSISAASRSKAGPKCCSSPRLSTHLIYIYRIPR